MLRREVIVQPDGKPVYVPVISGNAFRGRLRRIGEELLRDTLHYEGQLTLPAAHALRGGGSLAKVSSAPLSGRRLAAIRALIPQVGVFGCAAGGRIISGCLQVGKIVPFVAEAAHIIPAASSELPGSFTATQVETYVRQDDSSSHSFTDVVQTQPMPVDEDGRPDTDALPDISSNNQSQLMIFRAETFPAGTRFHTWIRLDRATDFEVAFLADVLTNFAADSRIGGRAAIGHGQVHADLTRTILTGQPASLDWREHLRTHRDEALSALGALT
jgi:CRISPR type IV-associated protein Csf2